MQRNNFTERLFAASSLLSVDTDMARVASYEISFPAWSVGSFVWRREKRGEMHALSFSHVFIHTFTILPSKCIAICARHVCIAFARTFVGTSWVQRRLITLFFHNVLQFTRRTDVAENGERARHRRDTYVSGNLSDGPASTSYIHVSIPLASYRTFVTPHSGGENSGGFRLPHALCS